MKPTILTNFLNEKRAGCPAPSLKDQQNNVLSGGRAPEGLFCFCRIKSLALKSSQFALVHILDDGNVTDDDAIASSDQYCFLRIKGLALQICDF